MEIKFVTCSGVNETTDIPGFIALAEEYPIAEFGVQVSQKKCSYDSLRFKWITDVAMYAKQQKIAINMALHVNSLWAEECGQGRLAPELLDLLQLQDCNGDFFIKRLQINLVIGREQAPDEKKLASLIGSIAPIRCILPYNQANKSLLHRLYRNGVVFDPLYDESFGEGIIPETRNPPAFIDVAQGYAGGISPENVQQTLDGIYHKWYAQPNTDGIWIDAEGMLKGDNGCINLEKCQNYLDNANNWRYEHRFDF